MTMPLLPPIGNSPGFEEPREAPRAAPAAPASPAPAPAASPAPAAAARGPLPSPDGRHHVVPQARVVPWSADAPADTNGELPAPHPVTTNSSTTSAGPVATNARPAASASAAASPTQPAQASKPAPTSKRRGVGLPALIGIGVVGLVLGAGAVYGIQALNQPSALAGIPAKCSLGEGNYELSDSELVVHAPAAVSDAGRFAGDGACVLYELGAEPEGQTYVDYLATLEEPATVGGFTVHLDPESGELKVAQS